MKVKIFIALKSFETEHLVRPRILYNSNQELPSEVCKTGAKQKRALQKRAGPEGRAERRTDIAVGSSGILQRSLNRDKHISGRTDITAVSLPKKQSMFTVLRSPHIDKKSRDQFELKIHKQLVIICTEIKQVREKLSILKFHGIPGIQMKVVFQTKTRLPDKASRLCFR